MGIEVYAYCGWIVPSEVILNKMVVVLDPGSEKYEAITYNIMSSDESNAHCLPVPKTKWDNADANGRIRIIGHEFSTWYPTLSNLVVVDESEDNESPLGVPLCMIYFSSAWNGYSESWKKEKKEGISANSNAIIDFVENIRRAGLFEAGRFGVMTSNE